MKLLVLGGTAEAVELANKAAALGISVITALAGRTQNPTLPKGKIVTGGFGGAAGLEKYLKTQKIDIVVDATHPFAVNMSKNAVDASTGAMVELLRLERPAYQPAEQSEWWDVVNLGEAALSLPSGAVALLTVGRQQLAPFLDRPDVRFVARSIEPPEIELPNNFSTIQARPPFSRAQEIALMKHEGVTHLVVKNSGGALTSDKLEAAYMLKIQVIMVQRPAPPLAQTAGSVAEILDILAQLPAPKRRFFFLP